MTHKPPTQSYLSLHSPRGANAHFALGMFGTGGGFGLQSARAANEDVFIGLRRGTQIICLPFFKNAQSTELSTFLGEQSRPDEFSVTAFPEEAIQRRLGWGTDTWEAPRISFSLTAPVSGIPDPETGPEKLKDAIAPAIAAQLVIDNRDTSEPLQGFFGVSGLRGIRPLEDDTQGQLTGWVTIQGYGFACDNRANPNVRAVAHWDLPSLFTPPHPQPFRLGGTGVLLVDVPPGELVTVDFALGWYLGGVVTAGEFEESYAYTRYFSNLTDVLGYAVTRTADWRAEAATADRELNQSKLNSDQQFMLGQATRSYWASSMLFGTPSASQPHEVAGTEGGLRWVVNEGSFMMLNTFDLAVDHLFFELRQQPWVVRNVLDSFIASYSYRDLVHFPGEESIHSGGISFTHDQGAFNSFTPPGYSSYEINDQPGCYAYMTQEQLINWIVSAGLYVQHTADLAWAKHNREIITDCLISMLNRDHPDADKRDGIMDLDSSRTGTAEEITTYDSLDPSLGQARRNLYLAVKGWGAYLALEWLFDRLGDRHRQDESRQAAERAAQTIAAAFDPKLGYIPALLDGLDQSPIIPAVEGLIFPSQMGLFETVSLDGPYGELILKLRTHLENVLKPGVCLFPTGSWKLSAHSENSWISKVFLCQHIARKVLGIDFGEDQGIQDRAHADWWRIGSPSNPGIDQIFAGKTTEIGFYYPRAVTNILWLEE
jgi:xylan 1,4-beta-xylosidase